MSSQGPATGNGGPTGATGCYGPTGTSQVSRGYTFDTDSIRDGSDWIAYKKQILIRNENKTKNFKDPWFVHGNDYRLQYLQGVYKGGGVTGPACTGCTGGAAFGTNGPF